MDLDQGKNQNDAQIPPPNSTLVQASILGVALELGTKKLTVDERLSRLSKYRIRQTEIESAAEPNGKGGKADVVRASCTKRNEATAREVAVKMLRCTDMTDEEKFPKEFVHEVELLARLSHTNIVQLIGFVEDLKYQKAWIVLSWEPNGNVREFLASGKWEIPERISLIKDMFEGLRYLHTRQPPICHGDLKSLNLLVSSSYHAIITDFGSARVLNDEIAGEEDQDSAQHLVRTTAVDGGDNHPEVTVVASANQLTLTGPVWSLRWAAPEIVKEEERPGLASDIWSAGWVCWEMMTNKVPFEDLRRDGAIMLRVIQGKVPLIRKDAEVAQVIALCSLMTDCWKYKPEDRPHVDQCCQEVKWMPSVPPSCGTSSGGKEPSPTLLLKMGRMHYSHDRHKEAAALFEKVVTSAESDVHEGVVAEALEYLGDIHYIQCRYNEAEGFYARAQEIYGRIGDEQGQADTIVGLGDLYCAQCKYAEAKESYSRAQKIYARIGNDQGRASTIEGLGDVYCARRKYAKAKESYSRAQEIYARIGNDQGRANTIEGLADVYCALCKYTEAGESYMRAREIYTRIGDDQGRANTWSGLGDVYRAQRKYAEAEGSYTRAQAIYARIGNGQGRANTLRGLGHLYREQGHRMKAVRFYVQARDLYSQIGNPDDKNDASYWLDTIRAGDRHFGPRT